MTFLLPCLVLLAGLARDDWKEIEAAFRAAFGRESLDERVAAVERVGACGKERGFDLLSSHFQPQLVETWNRARQLEELDLVLARQRQAAEVRRSRLQDQRNRIQVPAELEELDHRLEVLELDLDRIARREREELKPLQLAVDEDLRLVAAFRRAIPALLSSLGETERGRAVAPLRRAILEPEGWLERQAVIETYAMCGDDQAVDVLLGWVPRVVRDRQRAENEIPELSEKLQKLLDRLARDRERDQPPHGPTVEEYERVAMELGRWNERTFSAVKTLHAIETALPGAVECLTGGALERAISKLEARVERGLPEVRQASLRALGSIDHPRAREALRGFLGKVTDDRLRVLVIESVAEQEDRDALDALLGSGLYDERWEIRTATIRALRKVRSTQSIPELLALLESETGRLQGEVEQTLHSLTGQRFHRNVVLWRRWWEKNREGFEPVAVGPLMEAVAAEHEPAFYGIRVVSDRVLFVIDVSGSMGFALDASETPGHPNYRRQPGEGEASRYDVVRREFLRALAGVRDEGRFNVVFYADRAMVWSPRMAVMSGRSRVSIQKFVQERGAPEGATNVFAALRAAFDLADAAGGRSERGSAVDTIYFLSDGHPTTGDITERDQLLEYVRRRNVLGQIIVHAIGVGDAHDALFLRRLAEENGGRYVAR